jgi:hypothetical protein
LWSQLRGPATRFVTVTALAALFAASCSGTDRTGGGKPGDVLVLHALNTRGEEDIAPFVDRLNQLSGGTLKLAVQNKWERQITAADADAMAALRKGKADLGVVEYRDRPPGPLLSDVHAWGDRWSATFTWSRRSENDVDIGRYV